jgi:hypothetical protein
MDEQYFLVTQGKFSWGDTEGMSIGERQYCCKKLVEEIKKHNQQLKEAQDLARSKAAAGGRR